MKEWIRLRRSLKQRRSLAEAKKEEDKYIQSAMLTKTKRRERKNQWSFIIGFHEERVEAMPNQTCKGFGQMNMLRLIAIDM